MTRLAAALALLLAGCGREGDAVDPNAPKIACAKGGAALAPGCTVDWLRGDGGLMLTLRHPDGAFRRLLVTTDGRGVAAADGAEPARVTVVEPGEIEVAVANERYRLPATIPGQGTPK